MRDRLSLLRAKPFSFRDPPFTKPLGGLALWNNSKDMNFSSYDVVKHPNFPDPEAVLRFSKTAEPLDSAFAHPSRFMPEMLLDSISHLRSEPTCLQPLEVFGRLGSEDDFEAQSGQMVARFCELKQAVAAVESGGITSSLRKHSAESRATIPSTRESAPHQTSSGWRFWFIR